MTEPSDPSLLPLIVGVTGTLLGTALGAMVTLLVQGRQLRHEDRTRFHDRRLQIYTDFNDACNKVVTQVLSAAPYPSAEIQRVIHLGEVLRLVASQSVVDAAAPVHRAINAVVLAGGKAPPDVGAWFVQFNTDLTALLKAMRAEIGVTEKP